MRPERVNKCPNSMKVYDDDDDDDDDDEVSFEIAITGMYSRIPWKLVADPLGCAEHNLGPTGL